MTIRERHEQWANETSVCTHNTNRPEPHRCSPLHRRVYTSPSKSSRLRASEEREEESEAVTNVAGAICIGQVVVLYMTTRRGGWETPRETRRNEKHPLILPSLAPRARCVRRVARRGCFVHFTYFAYETHADVKPTTRLLARALNCIANT